MLLLVNLNVKSICQKQGWYCFGILGEISILSYQPAPSVRWISESRYVLDEAEWSWKKLYIKIKSFNI